MSVQTVRRLPWPHPAIRMLVAPFLVSVGVTAGLAACSSPGPDPAGATTAAGLTASSASPTTTSSSTSTSAAPSLPGLAAGTVLAVKVDNTAGSRPRVGVDRAAVVYVEPVEGGLTRLMAVFSTAAGELPAEVGPIRSARESDTALLANWGRVALAYSGGSAYTRSLVDEANLASIPMDASGEGYRRAGDRKAPYNVIGDVQALLARAGTGPTTGDPGFRYGPTPAGGAATGSVSTSWSASRMTLTWDPSSDRYLVTTDGTADVDADGAPQAAGTVVVQEVPMQLSENRDVNGVQTPVVDLVGGGTATYLRDGRMWQGQWSRPDLGSPTAFTVGGLPMAMAGPVWVLLVPAGQEVALG